MRILVTGAGGFVGPYLVERLAEGKDKVFAMLGPRQPLPAPKPGSVQYLNADIVSQDSTRSAVERAQPDVVYHLAGWSHIGKAINESPAVYAVNLMGTLYLYEALREVSPRAKVLFVSTGAAYGPIAPDAAPPDENEPLQPQEPYAGSKAAADMASVQYFRSYGLPVVRVRPFNIIGPGQRPIFATSEWAWRLVRMEKGLEPPVLRVGKLDVERDFTDVRDMVRGFILALCHGVPGEVFNLGTGRSIPVGRVLDMLLGMVKVKVEVVQDPAKLRKVEPGRVTGSVERAAARLGWRTSISLEETLAGIVQYWRDAEQPRA